MKTYYINRILQPFLLLGLILLLIFYCIGLILIWFPFFIGGLFWKDKIQFKISDNLYDKIPKMP